MPYKHEHSVQYHNIDKYTRLRRKNNDFGDGIHAIYGILPSGQTQVQSLRFDANMYRISDVKTLIYGGLRELGRPLLIEPAVLTNPPEDISLIDMRNKLEELLRDERHAITKYANFLDWLPQHPSLIDLRKEINNIMRSEHDHFVLLQNLLRDIQEHGG